MSTKRRFDVCCARPKYNEEGVWWHKVGSAFENDKGQVNVFLNSVPVPDSSKDNQICFTLFEQKEDDKRGGGSGGRSSSTSTSRSSGRSSGSGRANERTRGGKDDDEIPF